MKVLTFNIHSWMEEDNEKQVEVLAQSIADNGYDIVALQEVNQSRTTSLAETDTYFQPVTGQKEIRKDNFMYLLVQRLFKLGCYYYWSWVYNHIGYDIYHEGVGVLTKRPFKARSFQISKGTNPNDYCTRNVLIATTRYEQQEMIIVNGHFSWWISDKEGFAYEWKQLESELKKLLYLY